MKKYLIILFCFLALLGCEEKAKETTTEDQSLNAGYIHFASILVLDDLVTNGISSELLSLSPIPIVKPDDTMSADALLEDFRQDFTTSQDKYPLKLSEGLALTWKVNYNADTQEGLFFHKETRSDKSVFVGKIALHFDSEYYSATSYPIYSKDSNATVICQSFTSATERKNDHLTWVEVALDGCMDASDYYTSLRDRLKNQQTPLKERLTNIYSGKESVDEEIALKLLAFYKAGAIFANDSVCLTGSREDCLSSLKTEIVRKFETGEQIPAAKVRVKEKAKKEASEPVKETKVETPANAIEKAAQALPVQETKDETKEPKKVQATEQTPKEEVKETPKEEVKESPKEEVKDSPKEEGSPKEDVKEPPKNN